jgi:superfamily II DNA or RNA helicase
MITPKTDIIQSVGRILRVKHENPIIVDIVDKHDVFQKQWAQRRRFYKKCNYRIRQIDSTQYKGMTIDWETDKTWKRVFEPKPITQMGGGFGLSGTGTDTICINDSDDDEPKPLASRKCMINIEECFGPL